MNSSEEELPLDTILHLQCWFSKRGGWRVGRVAPPHPYPRTFGSVWRCCWLSWFREWGHYWHPLGKGQGCWQTSYNAQDSPPHPNNSYLAQKWSVVPLLRNSDLQVTGNPSWHPNPLAVPKSCLWLRKMQRDAVKDSKSQSVNLEMH